MKTHDVAHEILSAPNQRITHNSDWLIEGESDGEPWRLQFTPPPLPVSKPKIWFLAVILTGGCVFWALSLIFAIFWLCGCVDLSIHFR